MSDRFQKIDEEGYLLSEQGVRMEDETFGREFLNSLFLNDSHQVKAKYKSSEVFVEAFDQPLIARHLIKENDQLTIELPYQMKALVNLDTLSLDEWDRFHGLTDKNVPFVLSRQAQIELFDLLDEFDDDQIKIFGKNFPTPPYFSSSSDVNVESFWTGIYESEEPKWDLKAPANALKDVLPQLKLSKQRVLVLGCGKGHDAAFLAQAGHLVTAVDISPSAIEGAKKQYSHLSGLEFLQADVFKLPSQNFGPFDLVFEHTCFCAIDPAKRSDLVKVWKKLLVDDGHLLGIFYVMPKPLGPPFGASEWEVRERLKPSFDFRYWTRWRNSIPRRQGNELVVYAQKIPKFGM